MKDVIIFQTVNKNKLIRFCSILLFIQNLKFKIKLNRKVFNLKMASNLSPLGSPYRSRNNYSPGRSDNYERSTLNNERFQAN